MTSNTRSTIIETMARAIVRAKGAEVCASDDEWPLAVAHHRAMTAKHGAAYTNGRSLYTDAFNFAEAALAAYEAHLEASGMAVVARAAWPPHVSFDIDGGLGLEWDGPGRSHYLIEVRGDADVVWIVRQDGKLLHGNEHKVGSGDGKAPAPEASAEGEARSTPLPPRSE